MWLVHLLIVLCFSAVNCSEYFIDPDECMLYSRNNSVLINLLSAHTETDDDFLDNNYTVYFSLCPKKNKICPDRSFICLVDKRDSKILDIGSSMKEISSIGDMIINLESPNGNGTIYIICRQDNDAKPMFESLEKTDSGNFTYSIRWISKESCPLKHYKAYDSCILFTEENSYDLRPLQSSSEYTIKSGPITYLVNFCKGVSKPDCYGSPICSVNSVGTAKEIALKKGSVIQYIVSRGLTLTHRNYMGGKTIMHFICSENIEPNIQFIEEDNSDIIFHVKTSIVCPPKKLDCLVKDKKNSSYDLSRLELLNTNRNLLLKDGKKIIFNICGSLNYVPQVLCSGGNYFACLIDSSNKTEALGNETNIEIISPGQISYSISGHTTQTKITLFSLNILLKCSTKMTAHPEIKKINSYVYDILWETYVACPSKISYGSQCSGTNLFRDEKVDVSSLRRDRDYKIMIRDETYRINICGNLKKSCNNTIDAAVCYKNKDNFELPIGIVGSSKLIFSDGEYMIVLKGHPCNDKVTRSKVTIIFKCEYLENGRNNFYPEYINKANDCEFYFLWKTDQICLNPVTSDCSLKHNGSLYDLTPLKNLKDNYKLQFDEKSEIVFNVCHSVISGARIQCPAFSGACLVNDNADYILSMGNKSIGLIGSVNDQHNNLEFLNGKLQLTYHNGGVCPELVRSTKGSLETIINFECNSTAVDTEPVFVGFVDCTYMLKWNTRVACPLVNNSKLAIEENKRSHEEDCIAVNIHANKKYDLSRLKGQNWYVKNKEIFLGICSPVKNANCSTNSGACLKTENGFENLGYYNSELMFEENSLYLLYKSGGSKQVFIEFVCSSTDSGPEFIKEIETVTYISWRTVLACDEEAKITCCNQIEDLCNFYNKTYTVIVNKSESVLLSLCRPVAPIEGFLCINSSSSCIGTESKNDLYEHEQSLGKIYQEPVIAEDGSAIVSYTEGSVCNIGTGLKYSTRIRFVCDKSNYNDHPKFINITDNCQYNFVWKTNLLCDKTEDTNCVLTLHNISSTNMELYHTDRHVNGQNGEYILNLCARSRKCGAHICKFTANKWEPFAVWNNTEISNSKVSINYKSLGNKSDYKCGATVRIIDCQEEVSHNSILEKETDCFLEIKVFIQNTDSSCSQKNVQTGNSSNNDSSMSHGEETNKINIRTETDATLSHEKHVNGNSSSVAWYIGGSFLIIILFVIIGFVFYKMRSHFKSNTIQRFFPRYRRLEIDGSTYTSEIPQEYNDNESIDLVVFSKK